jgi:RNA polymerase sigma-70 factor (ECF subfamily)
MHKMNHRQSDSDTAMPTFSRTQSYNVRIGDSLLPALTNGPTDILPFLDYRTASDDELLAAARSSDERAFAELSGRYRKTIHNTASRIVRHREDAEDVVQDTLFKAFIHLKYFRGTCRFSSWLTRIAINSALMLLRKRRSRSAVFRDQRGNEDRSYEISDFPDPSPNPEQISEKRQALDILSGAITRLPPAYRSVLTQFYDHEESMQRIADAVGITVAATKSRLRRARLSIRSTLEKSELRKERKVLNGRCATFESGWTA